MKMKKFNFDLRSVALGAVLCLVLVVFVGSRTAQTEQLTARTRIVQRAANLNDVMAKCELIDQRILVLEGKINHLQERVEYVLEVLGHDSRRIK